MTYNVFSGTLDLTQPINQLVKTDTCPHVTTDDTILPATCFPHFYAATAKRGIRGIKQSGFLRATVLL